MKSSIFLNEVRRKLEDKSQDSLKNAIINMAKFIPKSAHDKILSEIDNQVDSDFTFNLKEEKVDLVSLTKDLCNKIEAGEFEVKWAHSEGYGYWSEDEVLVDSNGLGSEIVDLLDASMYFVKEGRYKEALKAFDMLFKEEMYDAIFDDVGIISMFDQKIIKLDLYKVCKHYAYACIACLKDSKRINKFLHIQQFASNEILLDDIASINKGVIPDKEKFLKGLIDHLMKLNTIYEAMLIDAIRYSGGSASLESFVLENGKKYETSYITLMEILINEEQYERAVDIAKKALDELNGKNENRCMVSDKLLEVAGLIKDEDLIDLSIEEGFRSSFDLRHFLNLYDLKDKDKIKENIEYMDTNINGKDDDFFYIHFINGDYEFVWNECKKGKDLNVYSEPIKRRFIPLFIWALSGEEMLKPCMEKSISDCFYSKGTDLNSFIEVLVKSGRDLSEDDFEKYLSWCKEEIDVRVESIVSGKHKKIYYKASLLIVSMAEVIKKKGEDEAWEYINEYKEKYSKHSAFQGCLSGDIVLGGFDEYLKASLSK